MNVFTNILLFISHHFCGASIICPGPILASCPWRPGDSSTEAWCLMVTSSGGPAYGRFTILMSMGDKPHLQFLPLVLQMGLDATPDAKNQSQNRLFG